MSVASAETVAIPAAPPVNSARPTVSGTAQRGATLTGAPGTWSGIGNATTYQWQASPDGNSWTAITNATAAQRTLVVADVGKYLRVLVTVNNPEGSATASSVPVGPIAGAPPANTVRPTVSGVVRRAETLVSALGTWTGADNSYDYQWQRSADGTTWTAIAGATRPAYDLAVADVNLFVRVLITASNVDGTASAASAATVKVPSARRSTPPRRRSPAPPAAASR